MRSGGKTKFKINFWMKFNFIRGKLNFIWNFIQDMK